MKILLIYPEVAVGIRWTELLAVGTVSAMAKQAEHSVDFLYYKHPNQLASVEKVVRRMAPDLIIAYLAWDQWKPAIAMLREVKRAAPKAPLTAAGVYPTLDPDSVVEESSVDIMVVGENEAALNELIHCVSIRRSYDNLQNLWVKKGAGGLIKNPLRMLIANLDTLPFPDRSLFDHAALARLSGGGAPILAGRGCPHNCLFCYMPRLKQISSAKGPFVRARNPMGLAVEAQDLARRQRIHWIDFVDECFPQEVGWIEQFCAAWKTQVRLPFRFTAVAERVNPQILRLLKEAGCEAIRLGVETGNERFRARIADRNLSNERLEALCEEARRLEIEIHTCSMVGLPLENPDLARETVEFNRKLQPASARISIFRPIPGSSLHEFCLDKKYLRPVDEAEFNPRRTFLRLPAISDEEVLQTYDQMRSLNQWLRLSRAGPAPGYFDLASAIESAQVESAFQPALDVEVFTHYGEPRLCLLQAIGSRATFPVDLRESGFFGFGLALGPSPYGIRHSRPVQIEISLRQGEFEELAFVKILNPDERHPRRGWFDFQLPLFEWSAGPAQIILSASLVGAKPPAPMYVAWSRPFLSDRYLAGPAAAPGDSSAGEGTAKRILRLENENQQLRAASQKTAAEIEQLRLEIDNRKARAAELRVKQLELEKQLEALAQEKAEWTRLREEMERSMGEKLKRLFKRA